jgi:hypothetical protein
MDDRLWRRGRDLAGQLAVEERERPTALGTLADVEDLAAESGDELNRPLAQLERTRRTMEPGAAGRDDRIQPPPSVSDRRSALPPAGTADHQQPDGIVHQELRGRVKGTENDWPQANAEPILRLPADTLSDSRPLQTV